MKKIGVLALQGAFLEHERAVSAAGAEAFEIRNSAGLRREMDGLILPGGESTVMGKLLRELGLFEPLRTQILEGLPVFGTCAGLILLAQEITGERPYLGTMGITAVRNAYGRQLGSFECAAEFAECGEIPMRFIRAPYIAQVERRVTVLAEVEGRIVAAREGRQLVTAFHPELCENTAVHRYFLEMCGR